MDRREAMTTASTIADILPADHAAGAILALDLNLLLTCP